MFPASLCPSSGEQTV